MELLQVKVDGYTHFPHGLTLFLNPANDRMQLGFVDENGNCSNPILEIVPQGVDFIIAPAANAQGPVAKTNGWVIVAGYTKNP